MNATIDPIEIDRLVDGELDPDARRDLLNRLDSSPDGWRRCALAFLEGREFTLGSRAWVAEMGSRAGARVRTPAARFSGLGRLGMAAALVGLAFLAGFAARGWATVPAGAPRLLADSSSRGAPRPIQPSATSPAIAPAVAPPPTMPEYVQAQWARLGYHVEPTRRVISVEEGGRRATYPVDGYRFEFVGRPTY